MSFFNKSKEIKKDNVYTVLNCELERLHELLNRARGNESNVKTVYARIEKLQDALLEALKKQPSHHEEITDLQETVSELVLLGTGDGT